MLHKKINTKNVCCNSYELPNNEIKSDCSYLICLTHNKYQINCKTGIYLTFDWVKAIDLR